MPSPQIDVDIGACYQAQMNTCFLRFFLVPSTGYQTGQAKRKGVQIRTVIVENY